MRDFQKCIGLLCSDQLLRSDGHKRYLGLVPIAAESTAVGPSMDPLVAAAEVADGSAEDVQRCWVVLMVKENNLHAWVAFCRGRLRPR